MKTDHKFLILGAGMAGLGAGVALKKAGYEPIILEKEAYVGGLFSNKTLDGCDFDYGPKILLLDKAKYREEILSFLDGNACQYPVEEKVYLKKYGLLSFPLQRHLIELPHEVRQKIIADLEKNVRKSSKIENFQDWLIAHYGAYFAKMILIPYEEKKWQMSLTDMDYRWTETRPVKVDSWEVLKGAEAHLPPNRTYHYPKTGNIAVLTNAMAKEAGTIVLNHVVSHIDLEKKVVTASGKEFPYDTLISSLPLDFVTSVSSPVAPELAQGGGKLKRLSIKVLNLVYEGNHALSGSAIYFPEKEFVFRRVSILDNLCPALKRPGKTPISVEISVSERNTETNEELYGRVIQELTLLEEFKNLGTPRAWEVMDIDFAYPQQTRGRSYQVGDLHRYFAYYGVHHCGRGGTYDYCNGDVAYAQGADLAKDLMRKLDLARQIDKRSQTITIGIPYFGHGDIKKTVESVRKSDYGQDATICLTTKNTLQEELALELRKNNVVILPVQGEDVLGEHYHLLTSIATSDLLVFAYSGTVFDENALIQILDEFADNPQLSMVGCKVYPFEPQNFFDRCRDVGLHIARQIAVRWNSGDNYLSANGRCIAFRTPAIKRFVITGEVANCDAYLYFENKRLGGLFKQATNAIVRYPHSKTFQAHLKQVERFLSSKEELSSILSMDLNTDYHIPRGLLLQAILKEFVRNPIYLTGYILLAIYLRASFLLKRITF